MKELVPTSCGAKLWAPLLFVLAALPASAQQQAVPNAVALEEEVEEIPEWAIEIIVFEYVGSAAGATEIFDPEPLPDSEAEPELGVTLPARLTAKRQRITNTPGETGVRSRLLFGDEESAYEQPLELIETFEQSGFRVLPAEDFQLTAAYERLVAIDAYRPVVHSGWIQPLIEQATPTPIKLRRISDPPLRLDGTVSLYLSRFLHLVVDLDLEAPAMTPQAARGSYAPANDGQRNLYRYEPPSAPAVTYFRIQEDRIMRNNEIRYFDHPRFGVIARVMRIEEAPEDELDTTGILLPGVGN